MRGQDVRAAWADASGALKKHIPVAQDILKEHWLPVTAAAAGLYCLWRLIRFIRWVTVVSLHRCMSWQLLLHSCGVEASVSPAINLAEKLLTPADTRLH